MNDATWLLYGATGFTGRLVAEEAVKRGHRPVLGGRSADKLRLLAEACGLDYVVCHLGEAERLAEIVGGFELVCNLAGPYVHTFESIVRACLEGSASYIDVTGEISVLQAMRAYEREAEEKGVALIPAAGFIATPTDCCARYAAEHLSNPIRLETAVASAAKVSPGTAKTILQMLPNGIMVRRKGELVRRPFGRGARRVAFLDRDRPVVPAPLADLVTGYRTTGIADITTYVSVPDGITPLVAALGPVAEKLLALPALQQFLRALVDRFVAGPDADHRRTARSYTWVRAVDETGTEAEVWLETAESYQFTAHAVVRAAERILTDHPKGLLTSAQAFGSDFVMDIPGTVRREAFG